jgi:hypothetical protein
MSIIGSLPYTLTNGQNADATQVMANYNTVTANVNANAAANGPNSDITSLSACTSIPQILPTGSVLGAWLQAAAPTGWTQVRTFNDAVLRFVSGSGGGATGGSWTITGSLGSTDAHTLAISEIPAHAHGVNDPTHSHTVPSSANSSGGGYVTSAYSGPSGGPNYPTNAAATGISIQDTGGGGGHNHTLNNISSDATWRPAYVNALVASKD